MPICRLAGRSAGLTCEDRPRVSPVTSVGIPGGQRQRFTDYLVAGAVFVLYLSLNIAILHRYGITTDEPEHWFFGDRYLQFYLTFDQKALDFTSIDFSPGQTWPVGPTLAALSAKLFSEHLKLVNQYDGHHLASVFLFGLLLSSVYLFLVVHAGFPTAVLSCLALALHPRIWGEAHNNAQDIPHLVFYSMSILTFAHAMMTRKGRWLLASAICWGLALGSKINALSLPVVVAPMLISLLRDSSGQSPSVKRSLAAYPVIALSVLFLAWPYFWHSPVDRLSHFWSYLMRWGVSGPMAWQASPVFNVLITSPLPTLVFALVGIVVAVRGHPLGRPMGLTFLVWLLVPITRSSLPGVLNYDVIRRLMEFTPALAILAGIGGASLIEWGAGKGVFHLRAWGWVTRVAVVAAFLSSGVALWRYFPYESTYYNLLVGGLGGAQTLKLHQSADYWLSSHREGVSWINGHADARSFLIVPHSHLIPYYPLRKDLAMTKYLWMDDLPARGRAVYLMYVPTEPYDYNMCLAEAFLRPEYEVRRDGGLILRIYKLAADSHLAVTRNAFPPPQGFSVTLKRRRVTFSWRRTPIDIDNVVGHIIYYGQVPGQYKGSVCVRGQASQWEVFADVPYSTYYLSLSVLTRQAQESERTPDIRQEYFE